MAAMNFVAGVIYLAAFLVVFRSIWKKNLFWLYFISVEYFYVLGLGIYPIAMALEIADEPRFVNGGDIDTLVPFHICAYAIGAFLGYYFTPRKASVGFASFAEKLNVNPRKAYGVILAIFALSAIAYAAAVGLQDALLGASYARSGNFDFFEMGSQYAFLKRPLMIGLLGSAYAYYFIYFGRTSAWYLVASIVIGAVVYSFTVSRYALFQSILIPVGIYTIYKFRSGGAGRLVSVLYLCVGVLFSIGILLYGKVLSSQLAGYYFFAGNIDLNADSASVALDQFSHLYYSIDAGIKHFFTDGPAIFQDIVTAPMGIFPSSVFTNLGLESLSYQLLSRDNSFACVNTAIIAGSYGECYLPAYFTGASAYILPVVGAFVFGILRFSCYAIVCRAWELLDNQRSASRIPTVLVLFVFMEQVMLFIPATISMVSFMLIISTLLIKFGLIRYR